MPDPDKAKEQRKEEPESKLDEDAIGIGILRQIQWHQIAHEEKMNHIYRTKSLSKETRETLLAKARCHEDEMIRLEEDFIKKFPGVDVDEALVLLATQQSEHSGS